MGASASVSKQDVSALSAEQKKELVAKLEPPYCQKMGVENESLTPLRDEFLQCRNMGVRRRHGTGRVVAAVGLESVDDFAPATIGHSTLR